MAKKDYIDREIDEEEGTEESEIDPNDEDEEEEPAKEEPKSIDLVAYERELRRYVKRDGGFRKDLPAKEVKRAKEIMKVLDRKKPEWNPNVLVPGYDKPTVHNMNLGTGSRE